MLGGGISGLAAAWNLARKGLANVGSHGQFEVALFEASNRVGGWIKTEQSEAGALFELGPRSLRTAGIAGKTSLELVYKHIHIHVHVCMRSMLYMLSYAVVSKLGCHVFEHAY